MGLWHKLFGTIAQRLERRTHNSRVVGSNPTGPTKRKKQRNVMKQSDRIAALEAEVKAIRAELEELKARTPQTITQGGVTVTAEAGKWGVKVPVDENEWIWVSDYVEGKIMSFDSKEAAEAHGKAWGMHRVHKIG